MDPKPYIGGQAVIEGVMMRSPGCLSVAVRRPDGQLAVREGPLRSKLARWRGWKLPLLRGVATLGEALSLGFGALQFSAEQQMSEEERAAEGDSTRGAVAVSILLALALFMALPQLLTGGLGRLLGVSFGVQTWQFHAITGGFKLLVLTSYLVLISRLPDVRRVFQYHGAEHKTIYAYEQGLELTVPNVQSQSTLHPRCGTTFLIVVIVVSVLLGSAVTPLVLPDVSGWQAQVLAFLVRVSLLPVIAAVSYELQRLSARYCTRGPLRMLLWPGFAFQLITTREPDDDQVEVAITAMQTAIWREQVGEALPPADPEPRIFASFDAMRQALAALRPGAIDALRPGAPSALLPGAPSPQGSAD